MIADGKHIAQSIENELSEKLKALPQKKVCFILFGNDPASRKFIEMKSKVALRLGIAVDVVEEESITSTSRALEIISKTAEQKYDGMVVQLPLPKSLDADLILNAVPKELDIDVLGNLAKLDYKKGVLKSVAPVANAVMEILEFYKVDLLRKNILVIGRGKLVGEPVCSLLSQKEIPFEVIDITTPESERLDLMKSADIIISGVGSPHFLKPDMIKDGVILIDAGTSSDQGKLVGDIDPACAEKATLFTPVPGGIGPLTVVSLFKNLVR